MNISVATTNKRKSVTIKADLTEVAILEEVLQDFINAYHRQVYPKITARAEELLDQIANAIEEDYRKSKECKK